MIGRGDLHGAGSPVASPRAYLFRIASHNLRTRFLLQPPSELWEP